MTQESTASPRLVPLPRTGLAGASGVFLHLLVLLASAIPPLGIASYFEGGTYLPLAAVEAISAAALILFGIYFIRCTGSTKRMLPLLIMGTVFTVLSFRSIIPAAIIFSLLFVTSEGAFLVAVASKRGLAILPLLPIGSFLLAVALCGHIHGGVLALLPFPAAVALALGTRSSAAKPNGLTRVGVICLTTLFAGLSLAAVAAYFLHLYLGTLDGTVLLTEFEAFRTALIDRLIAKAAEAGGQIAELMTSAYITSLVNSLFNLLPGYLVAGICIYAAIAQMMLLSGLQAGGFGASVTDRVRGFRISRISDIVFIAAYLLMLFGSNGKVTMAGTVAHNLVIILQPGLALGGLLRLVARLARRGSRSGCTPFLLFLVPVLLFLAPTFLAIYEAIGGLFFPLTVGRRPSPPDAGTPPSDHTPPEA